jgi:acyl carrier protein
MTIQTSTLTPSPDVLADVAQIIREIIGEEYVGDLPITTSTSFSAELELESIELVALAERLRARFGEQLNLAAWLGDMELQQIVQLTVGDLVQEIVRCTCAATTA